MLFRTIIFRVYKWEQETRKSGGGWGSGYPKWKMMMPWEKEEKNYNWKISKTVAADDSHALLRRHLSLAQTWQLIKRNTTTSLIQSQRLQKCLCFCSSDIWQYWHFDLRLKDGTQVRGKRVLGNKDQPKSFGKIFTSTNVALSPLESLESFVFRANCSVCVQTLPNPPLGIITPIWQASFDKEAPQTAIALIKAGCQFSLFTHAAAWLGGIR